MPDKWYNLCSNPQNVIITKLLFSDKGMENEAQYNATNTHIYPKIKIKTFSRQTEDLRHT